MKASELIEKLERLIREHGDLEVEIVVDGQGATHHLDVSAVRYMKNGELVGNPVVIVIEN